MELFLRFFVALRIIVMLSFVCWSAAAIATNMYGASVFFALFALFIWVTRKQGDAHLRSVFTNKDK